MGKAYREVLKKIRQKIAVAHQLTACIWFGLTPLSKSLSATSDTRGTLGGMHLLGRDYNGHINRRVNSGTC